jgi:hypothetical protein
MWKQRSCWLSSRRLNNSTTETDRKWTSCLRQNAVLDWLSDTPIVQSTCRTGTLRTSRNTCPTVQLSILSQCTLNWSKSVLHYRQNQNENLDCDIKTWSRHSNMRILESALIVSTALWNRRLKLNLQSASLASRLLEFDSELCHHTTHQCRKRFHHGMPPCYLDSTMTSRRQDFMLDIQNISLVIVTAFEWKITEQDAFVCTAAF